MPCRFISLLLVLCPLLAGAQAFTPLRPFVFTSTAAGPDSIPGLYMWFKASSFTNNGPINLWTDVISSFVFTQTAAAYQPVKTNSGVLFGQTWNFLTNFDAKASGYHYVIFNRTDGVGQNIYLKINSIPTTAECFQFRDPVSIGNKWIHALNAGTQLFSGPEDYVNQFSDYYAGGNNYTNGVLATAFGGPSASMSVGVIGCEPGGDSFKGYLYELLIFTNDLTAGQVAFMHNYATNTYWSQLQGYTKPNILVQPSSITCLTNTVQKFSIYATGFPSALTFQWSTNGVNLTDSALWSGTTTSNLWVTNGSILFSNLPIQCAVANVVGANLSSVAYLNVVGNPLELGLVGWWTLDEGSGTNAADSSRLGNTGNLTNSPPWVAGQIGNAVYIPYSATVGAAKVIRITNSASLNNFTSITMTAWAYKTNAATGQLIQKLPVADGTAIASANPYNLYALEASTNHLYVAVSTGVSGSQKRLDAAISTGLNAWHHYAGTYDGTNIVGYLDGASVGTLNAGKFTVGSFNSSVFLGAAFFSDQPELFQGYLDDVRIYNRALSATEITNLFNWRP